MHSLRLVLSCLFVWCLTPALCDVPKKCIEDLQNMITNPSYELFTQYVTTSNPGPYNFADPNGILTKSKEAGMSISQTPLALYTQTPGSWDFCQTIEEMLHGLKIDTPTLSTHACMVPMLSMGFCLPTTCNPREWSLQDDKALIGKLKRWSSASSATSAGRVYAASLDGSASRFLSLPKAATVCSGQTESLIWGKEGLATDEWNTYRMAMAAFCSVLAMLALVGTAVDHYASPSGGSMKFALAVKSRVPAAVDFSLISNGNDLLKPRAGGHLKALDGLRAISAMWIVYGHYGLIAFVMGPAFRSNPVEQQKYMGSVAAMALRSTDIAVDSFFLLSAFLATYTGVRKLRKACLRKRVQRTSLWSILRYAASQYSQRYLRLTPAVVFSLLFFWAFLPMIGNTGIPGPYSAWWTQAFFIPCSEWWWTSTVHVTNLVGPEPLGYPGTRSCFGHIWYISCEMQLFLLVPFLIMIFVKSPRLGTLLAFVLMSASIIFVLCFASIDEWDRGQAIVDKLSESEQFGSLYFAEAWLRTAFGVFLGPVGTEYYGTPWARAPSYLIGVLLGMIYTSRGEAKSSLNTLFTRVKASNIACTSILLLGLTGVGGVCYGAYNIGYWTPEGRQFWIVLKRPVWTTAVAMLLLLCFEGRGSIVQGILGLKIWAPLSTLSFALYLVHLPIVFLFASSFASMRFNVVQHGIMYMGVLTCSLLVALVLHLLLIVPVTFSIRRALKALSRVTKRATTSKSAQEKEEDLPRWLDTADKASLKIKLLNPVV